MPIQTAPTTNSEVAISPTLSPDTAVATDTSLTTSANLRDTAQQHLDTENRADIQNPPNTTTSDFVSRSEYDRLRTDNFRSIIRDLKYAMDGYTSSYWEKDIVRSMQRLENYTPEEKAEFIKMYEADGRSLQADLKSELSPQDYAKCMGYLRTDNDITTKLTEYAADLNYAMKGGWGIGTDEKTIARIMNEVEKLSPAEKGQLKSIYNKEFGSHLEEHLKGELSGNDLHSALGKLNGPTYAAERINSTKSISEIHKLLKDASPEELAEIKQAFQERYGQSLAEYIEQCPLRRAGSRGVASSIRQQALKDQLLVTLDGSPEAKEALVLAAYLKSPRDNAEKIEKLLENKTPEQIAALEAKYKEMYGSRADYRNDERILKLFTRNLSSQPAETVVSKEPEAEIKTSAAGVLKVPSFVRQTALL